MAIEKFKIKISLFIFLIDMDAIVQLSRTIMTAPMSLGWSLLTDIFAAAYVIHKQWPTATIGALLINDTNANKNSVLVGKQGICMFIKCFLDNY